jgi:hypothetical protein
MAGDFNFFNFPNLIMLLIFIEISRLQLGYFPKDEIHPRLSLELGKI